MADYNNRDNRSGGGRGGKKFGGGRGFGGGGGRDSERPTMHKAVCDECGNGCEVPFRPSGDKPVFCSDCFRQNSKSNSFGERDSGERRFSRDRDSERPAMHKAVCDSCGDSCEVPFRPSGDKPVYCNQCFSKGGNDNNNKNAEQTNEQFEILNAKLDKILKMITPVIYKEVPKKEEKVVAEKKVATEEKIEAEKPKKVAKKAVKKAAKKA